jgi:transposase-like protein
VSEAPDCPFCGSVAVERIGQWGGQIITAQWRCLWCGSYYEAIREELGEASSGPDPAISEK